MSTPAIANLAMLGISVWVKLVLLLSFQISGHWGLLPYPCADGEGARGIGGWGPGHTPGKSFNDIFASLASTTNTGDSVSLPDSHDTYLKEDLEFKWYCV